MRLVAVTTVAEEYERTLLRVGREVLRRRPQAPAVKLGETMPRRSEGPAPPRVCDLVSDATLDPTDLQLTAWTRQVLTEVLEELPR